MKMRIFPVSTAMQYGVRDNYSSQIQIIYLIAFCLLFQLPTTVWAKTTPTKTLITNKEYLFQKLLEQTMFIQTFLNSITQTMNTTTDINKD